jgi:glycosyltransferase involved in cell wall biosynthesis
VASSIRVAHVIHDLRPGGTERRLLAVLAGLDPARFESLLVCIEGLGELAAEARSLGVEPVVLGRARRYDPISILRLARLLRIERVQVVHGWLSLANWYACLAGTLARVPVRIATEGATVVTRDERRMRRDARINRAFAPLAGAFVANSESVATSLRRRGIPDEKIEVIPNGVADPAPLGEDEQARLRAELGAGRGTRLIGMTARLDESFKDHETLLRSVQALVAEARSVEAVIVGDGPARASLERLVADLGIADRVTFTGFRPDAARLVGAFDVSVLLTYSEGFSNAVLESMVAGVPLLTTDIPPNREALDNGVEGLLVPIGDGDATTAALRTLLDDGDLAARLAAAAKRRARARFSLEAQAARIMGLYEDLLVSKGARV